MPTPTSISSAPMSKVVRPAAGTVQLVNATPIDAVAALTRSPTALHSSSAAPASAAAPTIFSTISVPATPRRPVVWVELAREKAGRRLDRPAERLAQHRVDVVDELLHAVSCDGSLLKHGVAHGGDRDLAGLATGVDVAERALAEERSPALAGDHVP